MQLQTMCLGHKRYGYLHEQYRTLASYCPIYMLPVVQLYRLDNKSKLRRWVLFPPSMLAGCSCGFRAFLRAIAGAACSDSVVLPCSGHKPGRHRRTRQHQAWSLDDRWWELADVSSYPFSDNLYSSIQEQHQIHKEHVSSVSVTAAFCIKLDSQKDNAILPSFFKNITNLMRCSAVLFCHLESLKLAFPSSLSQYGHMDFLSGSGNTVTFVQVLTTENSVLVNKE